jgi:hypothetical protein
MEATIIVRYKVYYYMRRGAAAGKNYLEERGQQKRTSCLN